MQLIGARWLAVALVGVLAIAVLALSALALQRTREDASAQPNLVPSFSLGVQTPTPTPEPTSPPDPAPPGAERFFSIGADAWWRATAGRCGEIEPVVERSVDQGQTWTDVTPRYLGLSEVLSLDAITSVDGQLVAKVGQNCEVQALRTYTEGRFWESYPDVLAASRFIDPAVPATVDLGAETIAAPCDAPTGLRASGPTVALLCQGTPFVSDGGGWRELAAPQAAAVAMDGGDVMVAWRDDRCDGTAVTRFPAGSLDAPVPAGCFAAADPASPAALALATGAPILWSADQLLPAS